MARKDIDSSLILAFSVSLAVVSTAAVTFTLTKRREQEKQRIVEYQRYLQQKELQKAQQESSDASSSSSSSSKIPSGVPLENIKIDKVYLWQCENLRLRFPSANVSNFMKIDDDDNTTKYNKLIKDQDCVLAT